MKYNEGRLNESTRHVLATGLPVGPAEAGAGGEPALKAERSALPVCSQRYKHTVLFEINFTEATDYSRRNKAAATQRAVGRCATSVHRARRRRGRRRGRARRGSAWR